LKGGAAARELWEKLGPDIRDFLRLPHAFNPIQKKTLPHIPGDAHQEGYSLGWSSAGLVRAVSQRRKTWEFSFWHQQKIYLALFSKNGFPYIRVVRLRGRESASEPVSNSQNPPLFSDWTP
jgi:hypothetical protein